MRGIRIAPSLLFREAVAEAPDGVDEARRAFEWFLGRNDLDQPLYNTASGGCYDGLHFDRVNLNQGAESTLAFLLALEEMKTLQTASAAFTTVRNIPKVIRSNEVKLPAMSHESL